jgi:hypothetical protein
MPDGVVQYVSKRRLYVKPDVAGPARHIAPSFAARDQT